MKVASRREYTHVHYPDLYWKRNEGFGTLKSGIKSSLIPESLSDIHQFPDHSPKKISSYANRQRRSNCDSIWPGHY